MSKRIGGICAAVAGIVVVAIVGAPTAGGADGASGGSAVAASSATFGSPSFMPTAENAVGWRGDGSGRYPGATPPKEWYLRLANCPGLATSASKPKEAAPKVEPLLDIALNDWVAIGPWTTTDKKSALDTAHLADELTVEPSDGDKAGDKQWKKLPMQNGAVCLADVFGESPREKGQSPWEAPKQQKVIYAVTYVYAPSDGVVALYWTHNDGCRLYLNGVKAVERNGDTYTGKPQVDRLTLKQGWNRLMLKSWGYDGTWAFSMWMRKMPAKGAKGYEYESKNIVYKAPLPSSSVACPIVVGDRIFITGDHWVAALAKADGKLLWYRTIVAFDGKAEDTQGDAELAKQYNAACKKLHDLDEQAPVAFKDGKFTGEFAAGSKAVHDELAALLMKLDPKRAVTIKGAWQLGEPGWAVTPCSDGKSVYVWSQLAVAACFSLDGKQAWSTTVPHAGDTHHGYAASPVIVDGKFLAKQAKIWAFDLKTGQVAWSVGAGFSHGSFVRAKASTGEPVLVEQDNIFHSTKDGSLFRGDKGCKDSRVNTCSSPIAFDDKALSITSAIAISQLGDAVKHTIIPTPTSAFCGGHYADGPIASPVYHDGYAYIMTMGGTLWTVDVKTGKVVGNEHLDTRTNWGGRAGSTASPAYAGGMLYFFDDSGNTLVREPGPQGKVVARHELVSQMAAQWDGRNNWDHPWSANSTPVFDGARIYWRIGSVLYCVGEK